MAVSPYEKIDLTITEWASQHRLQVWKHYKDYEVRSVDIARRPRLWIWPRRSFQIWIDAPRADGVIGVHAWDRRDLRGAWESSPEQLRQALDKAFEWTCSHE